MRAINKTLLWFILLITAIAASGKLAMIVRPEGSLLVSSHPLLPWLSLRQIAIIAVLLEVVTILSIAFGSERAGLNAACAFYTCVAIYRLLLHFSDISYSCFCFGNLHRIWGISDGKVEQVSLVILYGILLATYGLLALNFVYERRHSSVTIATR